MILDNHEVMSQIRRELLLKGKTVSVRSEGPDLVIESGRRSVKISHDGFTYYYRNRDLGFTSREVRDYPINFLAEQASAPPPYLELCFSILAGAERLIPHLITVSEADHTVTIDITGTPRAIVIGRESGLISLAEWTEYKKFRATEEEAIAWICGK